MEGKLPRNCLKFLSFFRDSSSNVWHFNEDEFVNDPFKSASAKFTSNLSFEARKIFKCL